MLGIDDLSKVTSVSELNNWGEIISHGVPLPDYYDDYMSKREVPRLKECVASFIMCHRYANIRFVEIDVDGDIVCVIFKSIFFSSPPSMIIMDTPVSKRGIKENVIRVLNVFNSLSLNIRFICYEDTVKTLGIQNVEPTDEYSNFFDEYNFMEERLKENRYAHKHRVKALEENTEFLVKKTMDDTEKDELLVLRDKWLKLYPGKYYGLKKMEELINFNSDDMLHCLTYYKGMLVANDNLIVQKQGVVDYLGYNLCREDLGNSWDNRNMANLDRFTRLLISRYCHNTLGIDRVFYLGSGGDHEGLASYKRRISYSNIKGYHIRIGNNSENLVFG